MVMFYDSDGDVLWIRTYQTNWKYHFQAKLKIYWHFWTGTPIEMIKSMDYKFDSVKWIMFIAQTTMDLDLVNNYALLQHDWSRIQSFSKVFLISFDKSMS